MFHYWSTKLLTLNIRCFNWNDGNFDFLKWHWTLAFNSIDRVGHFDWLPKVIIVFTFIEKDINQNICEKKMKKNQFMTIY